MEAEIKGGGGGGDGGFGAGIPTSGVPFSIFRGKKTLYVGGGRKGRIQSSSWVVGLSN